MGSLAKSNEVNYLAVSSQRVQRSEKRLTICKPSKEYVVNERIPNSNDFFASLSSSAVVSTVTDKYATEKGIVVAMDCCNFHFRYVRDKILFTLQVSFARNKYF